MTGKRNPRYLSITRRVDDCEILNRAMALIEPSREQEASCKADIEQALRLLRLYPSLLSNDGYVSLRGVREELSAVRNTAKQLQKKLRSIRWLIVLALFGDHEQAIAFLDRLDRLEQDATDLVERSQSAPARKGGSQIDVFKRLAAGFAFMLMKKFGKRPTKTTTGPYYELASVLYEGATGLAGASLDRICRKMPDQFKGESPSFFDAFPFYSTPVETPPTAQTSDVTQQN
jgi:hypothetical protein